MLRPTRPGRDDVVRTLDTLLDTMADDHPPANARRALLAAMGLGVASTTAAVGAAAAPAAVGPAVSATTASVVSAVAAPSVTAAKAVASTLSGSATAIVLKAVGVGVVGALLTVGAITASRETSNGATPGTRADFERPSTSPQHGAPAGPPAARSPNPVLLPATSPVPSPVAVDGEPAGPLATPGGAAEAARGVASRGPLGSTRPVGMARRVEKRPIAYTPNAIGAASAPEILATGRTPEAVGTAARTPEAVESAHAAPSPATAGSADMAAASQAKSGVNGASLREETALLGAAQRALERGDVPSALAGISRYEAEFPSGALKPEAAFLRIEAYVQRADLARARLLAKQFQHQFPSSPHLARVLALTMGDQKSKLTR